MAFPLEGGIAGRAAARKSLMQKPLLAFAKPDSVVIVRPLSYNLRGKAVNKG
jgi:hypothetical protein